MGNDAISGKQHRRPSTGKSSGKEYYSPFRAYRAAQRPDLITFQVSIEKQTCGSRPEDLSADVSIGCAFTRSDSFLRGRSSRISHGVESFALRSHAQIVQRMCRAAR